MVLGAAPLTLWDGSVSRHHTEWLCHYWHRSRTTEVNSHCVTKVPPESVTVETSTESCKLGMPYNPLFLVNNDSFHHMLPTHR